jgi:hypothetical protein
MANRRTGPRVDPEAAFINVPYDAQYEPLFLALIAGLAGFGLAPQAVLQIPGSKRRLDRILGLIGRCRYSFHDLSRVELDAKHPRTPRFNMPFELGLAVAWAQRGNPKHKWYVLESRRYRLAKSLSDLDGTQVYVHGGTPTGVLKLLTNALARSTHEPTVQQLKAVYQDVRKAAEQIKKVHATCDVFDTRPFLDLVYAASASAKERIAPSH